MLIGQGDITRNMHYILYQFHIDVAEVAFNRCVTTNEGERFLQEEVHATNDTFEVQYNYEFLEDFKDKHSSDR